MAPFGLPLGYTYGTRVAVLPVGRFSRTIGLFFSLRCGIFFAVVDCVILG